MSKSNGRKSIFITGAGSGIGRATAELFAAKGWFVGCFDVNEAALKKLQSELGADNGLFVRLDVTDRDAVTGALHAFSEATGGQLDLLYNNAGIDAQGVFETMAWEKILAVVNVNFVAGMDLIQKAIPLLKATGGSLCMSTSSATATFSAPGLAVYSATKHAIRGLTEALSVELAQYGVRVADVLPGLIDTGMMTEEIKAIIPAAGPWSLQPPSSVAEAVWAAYHGDKLHYYVPEEIYQYDIEVTTTPEIVRDRRAAGQMV